MKIRKIWMRTGLLCLLCFLSILNIAYGKTQVEIWHDPPTCAVVGRPIGVAADILSPTSVQEARIYFKQHETSTFYFVPLKPEKGTTYLGTLPPPTEQTSSLDYVLLVVDRNEQVVKSQILSAVVKQPQECLELLHSSQQNNIIVYAETPISPEIGFSGENVTWQVAEYAGKPYFREAKDINVQSFAGNASRLSQEESPFLSGKAIGIGAGAGALAVAGVLIANNLQQKEPDLIAELVKTPNVQTTCGTIVTNQLYVTNKKAESITIGTIDYEVKLTKEKPVGSCEAGRAGTFAPNWATVVPPDQRILIREWSNEVNPCSDCPYLLSECRWDSQYVVHTSAGDVKTQTNFTVKGNLCGASAKKSCDGGVPIKGDVEP
jgi:hypothetical protein